jgi:hypothetical protein
LTSDSRAFGVIGEDVAQRRVALPLPVGERVALAEMPTLMTVSLMRWI